MNFTGVALSAFPDDDGPDVRLENRQTVICMTRLHKHRTIDTDGQEDREAVGSHAMSRQAFSMVAGLEHG